MKFGLGLAVALTLSACAGGIVPRVGSPTTRPGSLKPERDSVPTTTSIKPVTSSATTRGATAQLTGVVAGPQVASLPITPDQATRALTAFRLSCPGLLRRGDKSGLTQADDWAPACAAAETATDTRGFFIDQFEAIQVGSGQSYATGYYEPEIQGSRTRDAANQVPVYAKPDDLVEIDLGTFTETLKGRLISGRVSGLKFVPYYDRGEIDDGAIAGQVPVIAWAADPIEFFFLQIQGSGRLKLADGSVMRIGYAGQNGRDYVGIGALMRDRGLVVPGQLSMQGIMARLRANSDQGRAIMRENKSFVFFREIMGEGPIGALGIPVRGRVSVAVDPSFVPLGAPMWLDLDRPEASGLWIAQDTGGAIKGANRVDTFWGAGEEARRIAGGMSGRGPAYILVPRGTLARLGDAAHSQP